MEASPMSTIARLPRAASHLALASRSERPRAVLAALALFVGLSAANASGGLLQLAFLGLGAVVVVTGPHRVPLGLLAGAGLCGVIALLSSLQAEPGMAPLLRVIRPCIEGYLLAMVLHRACRIRDLEALLTALAGYVLIQSCCAAAMAASPSARSELLEAWYGDDSYDSAAFQFALLFRAFGVSRHHLFGLPLALGLIGALLLIGASDETRPIRRALLTGAALATAPLVVLNARIGLVPLLLCYVLGVSVFFRLFYLRQVLLLATFGLPAAWGLAQWLLGDAAEWLLDWLLEASTQFGDPGSGGDSTTLGDLGDMIVLPAGPKSWLIGNGSICQPGDGCYSDIGWLRLLQEGGLMLAVPVTTLYMALLLRIHDGWRRLPRRHQPRGTSPWHGLLLVVLLLTFAAAATKGEAYAANDYSRLLVTLAVLMHQWRRTPRAGRSASSPAATP